MNKIMNGLTVIRNRLVGLFFRGWTLLKREGIPGTLSVIRNRLALDGVVSVVHRDQVQAGNLPEVSIIIPVFNALSLTRECIQSLSREIHSMPCEIIVVDNASTDGTPAWLEQESKVNPSLQVLTMKENLGFGPAVNMGVKSSRGEYVVILNNDTIPSRTWLLHLLEGMKRDSSIGILSPVTNYVGEGPQLDEAAKKLPADVERIDQYANEISDRSALVYEPNRLVFFCVMIRRELIDLIGGLDEGYLMGNFEDDDYCLRARMAGFRLAIAQNAFVYHHGSATFMSNRISHSRHMETNRVRFYKKAGRIAVSERGLFPSIRNAEPIQVSVILRTKDRPQLLRRALASLASQTFKGFEVVLVNDGGGDVSAIAGLFAPQFPITLISHEVSKGRTAAANRGWQESKGRWISFLDDDDILYPWHLESLLQAAAVGTRKFIYSDCNRALFLDEKRTTPEILLSAGSWEYDRRELLIKNNVPIHTWLYAREVAEKIGPWDESLDRMEDYDYLLRLSAVYPFHHLKKVTCEYRYYVDSANSIYTDRYRTLAAYEKIYERYPAGDSISRIRRQEVLDMIVFQIQKIEKIQKDVGTRVSREEAVRNIIKLVAGI